MASKYESAFQAAVVDRERQICIDLLRQSPELTLGEIHKLSKGTLGRVLDAISVAELLSGHVADSTGGVTLAAPAPARRERGAGRKKAAKVTRTARGRGQAPKKAAEAKAPEAAPEAKAAPAPAKAAPAPAKAGAAPAEAKAEAKPEAKSSARPEVETRTPAGRTAYDEAIFAALGQLGGGPLGVAALMKVAGGSNLQARAALNRLIAAGRVTWTGKARGTRYSLP
ncbi:MAG: hypothetical protein KC420_17250 [Myxococcales bacterium]|nr:hypothetical protein [Myxococcales bacterium]MCB9566594.1 hypothetical protein [Myxococcales bacterium]MCB9705557.1 hypothetical protein [Myxococcales bacterium]